MSSQETNAPAGQQYELVEDSAKIHKLLERLQTSHALISVRVPTVEETFNSMILEIDPSCRWLTLDELHPEIGHQKFLEQKKLSVYSEFEGVDLRFDGNLISVGKQSNIHFYKIEFPQKLKYFQKRSSYRVRVLRSAAIPVIIMIAGGEYAKGELYNISSGGIGVKFTRTVPKAIERGQIIPECEIRLPEGEKFICQLEARHLIEVKANEQALLGARFLKLNTVQQRMINRFIASLERELRRKVT